MNKDFVFKRTFSIIIPSFERPEKAEKAVNSIFQQKYDY